MGIAAGHGDGIWVEVETCAITRFGIGQIILHINRVVVIDIGREALCAG